MAKKILVVDDDPDLRDAAKIILESTGYDVLLAESGKKCLEVLKSQKVDLIILDVMMETDTEGFHIAYKIREDSKLKDVPIIMLTCIESKTGEVLEPEAAGDFLPVQAFLRKPLETSVLKSKIAELLGS